MSPYGSWGASVGQGFPVGFGGHWEVSGGGHSGVWVSPSVPGCPRVSPRVPVGDQDIPMGLRDGIRGLPRATGGLGVTSRCHRGRGGPAQPGDVLGDMRQQLEEREHALQLARDTIQVSASQIPAPGAIPGGHEDSPGGHTGTARGDTRDTGLAPAFIPSSSQFLPNSPFPGFFLSLLPRFSRLFPFPGFSRSPLPGFSLSFLP